MVDDYRMAALCFLYLVRDWLLIHSRICGMRLQVGVWAFTLNPDGIK